MKINIDKLQKIIAGNPNLHAYQAFGNEGRECLTSLQNQLKIIYQHYPAENISFNFTIVMRVTQNSSSSLLEEWPESIHGFNIEDIQFELGKVKKSNVVIELMEGGDYYLYSSDVCFETYELVNNYIIYNFYKGVEKFIIKSNEDFVHPPSPIMVSNFSIPTYHSLDEALDTYYIKMAKETTCKILQNIWHGGVTGPRLILSNKPESIMRDSLTQALTLVLGKGVEVKAEHNTDETKPVDIKVSWYGSRATALIEIKWLGSSIKENPKDVKKPFTTYWDSRAHDGAQQLIDYIDREIRSCTESIPQAYLVVFDARRESLKNISDKVSIDDAFFYEDKEITYDSKYDLLPYFNKHLRFYLRPRYSSL